MKDLDQQSNVRASPLGGEAELGSNADKLETRSIESPQESIEKPEDIVKNIFRYFFQFFKIIEIFTERNHKRKSNSS